MEKTLGKSREVDLKANIIKTPVSVKNGKSQDGT